MGGACINDKETQSYVQEIANGLICWTLDVGYER